MSRQERLARRKARIERQATEAVDGAVARVMAARPSQPSSPQDQAAEAKRLRDQEGMAWWLIGQRLGLAGPATTASDPEAKRGAGQARRLYAAANRGEVPRTHAPRKGAVVRPSGPASSGVPQYMRKQQLVDHGHVIPRDMEPEEVEALVRGRRIEWAIDLARLSGKTPQEWGEGNTRWVTQDAKVHVEEQWVKVVVDEDSGERLLYFREYLGFDSDRGKHMSGPTRTVRVDAIYGVR